MDSARKAGAQLIRQLSTRLVDPDPIRSGSKSGSTFDDGIEEEGIQDEEMLIDYKNTNFSKAKSFFETPAAQKSIFYVVKMLNFGRIS